MQVQGGKQRRLPHKFVAVSQLDFFLTAPLHAPLLCFVPHMFSRPCSSGASVVSVCLVADMSLKHTFSEVRYFEP